MLILESEGHLKVSDCPSVLAEVCNGCNRSFTLKDSFEPLVDRVRKRSYLIHPGCWDVLVVKLKGEGYENLPAWAKL